jgi:LuxR family glucitol operon transcriptional activator
MDALLSLIPEDLKRQLLDGLVGFLADQAQRLAGEKASEHIRRLSSEAAFLRAFDQALERGLRRFRNEYTQKDEDLVSLLVGDPALWRSPTVRKALRELVSRPGAHLPEARRQLLASFSDVLPQRVNRERVDRAVSYLLGCIAEELWSLPPAKEVREAYILQFQRITAEEARQQTALIQAQLQALTDLREEVRAALAQLTKGLARQALAAASIPALPVRPRPYHNLPQPDYARFVGREKEREWLRQRLSPQDRAWVVILSGIGGVGKTALALATAHEYLRRYDELPPEERFDAIVWASAKEEVLTAAGRERAAPAGLVARTLADIYAAIAQVLEREAITRAATREEQDRLVQQALTAQRTLLVLDNLDTLEGPGAEEVRAFLRNLPRPTKAIVTSRERLDVADVLTLRGMEEDEARQLMEAEGEARGVRLDAAQQAELYRRTAGLPLPIKLSIARLAAGETWEGVRRWLGDAGSDLVRYCVGGQVDLARRRSPEAYRLLLACSLFDRDAGAVREALGTIADLPLRDRDEGLALLLRLSLVNREPESDRFWLLPLVQEYARAELERADFRDELTERWLAWARDFALRYGADLDIHTTNAPIFAREYPNLRLAFRWCAEHERWEDLLALADGLWFYPYLAGLLGEATEILESAIRASQLDERIEGRFRRRSALILWDQGKWEECLQRLQEAEAIARQYNNKVELGLALERAADYWIERGEIQKGKELAYEALKAGEESGDLQVKVLAAYRLSMAESAEGDLETSLEWLDKGEVWARELDWSRALAWYLWRRGANLLEAGRPAEAEPYLLQAMETVTWDEPRFFAYAKYRLAQVYQRTGRLDLAHRTAEEARDLVERIGLGALREDVEALLRELEVA